MRLPVLAPNNLSDEQNALYATMRAEIKDHFHGFITEREDGALDDLNTDKGEVGGSSPPRPTIQITSKYAAILTFPLPGDLPSKTRFAKNLPKVRVGYSCHHQGRSDARPA
jgi:hypothetical protein